MIKTLAQTAHLPCPPGMVLRNGRLLTGPPVVVASEVQIQSAEPKPLVGNATWLNG